ncbi:MAG TPA: formyltransferase family protein [Candidatus Limnocylindrales bacterium]|nr:formyltransferase family protein [Candidatus Limnocylindrales bacterium]
MQDQGRRLVRQGMTLFLVGLLTGLAVQAMVNPRAGLAGHLEGVMNGIFLIVVGLAWKELGLGERAARITYALLVFGTWANWGTTTSIGILGTSRATPIAGAILSGDTETGVTLFRMDEGLDTGPILAQDRWPLAPDATADAVEALAARRAAGLLEASLPALASGDLPSRPQDAAAATLTRPLRREDGRLDPSRAAAELERRVRALRPWPGTFVETDAGRLVVDRAAVEPSRPSDVVGTLVADGDGLAIATSDGRLRLLDVRPAGGRPMTGEALRRGRQSLVGQVVIGRPVMAGSRA